MSYLSFNPNSSDIKVKKKKGGSVKKAFSDWIIKNHGDNYVKKLKQQRTRKEAGMMLRAINEPTDITSVGIIGGGFAGMYAGLILQSLGIECEVFEATDRCWWKN